MSRYRYIVIAMNLEKLKRLIIWNGRRSTRIWYSSYG
jgi:hypothetical protein